MGKAWRQIRRCGCVAVCEVDFVMITWIAFAKTMAVRNEAAVPYTTEPEFESIAMEKAAVMARFSDVALMEMLKVNDKIASRTAEQYQLIRNGEAEQIPALAAYSGAVFKRIDPQSFDFDDWRFAQDHLRIMSSLYGLLRPLDRISAYRLEAIVSLNGKEMVAETWRPLLTDNFIALVNQSGGVLLDLASEEMRLFLDWPKVCAAVRTVKVDFYERRADKLKSVTMYAKMCRGEMTRYVIRNRIDNPEDVKAFLWDGFVFDPLESNENHLVFVRG